MRRRLRLLAAFARQGILTQLAFRAAFWMRLLNLVVKVAAIAIVWSVLYRQAPGRFPVSQAQMTTYAIIAVLSGEVLTWWGGPHFYIAMRMRLGTITGDLLRPVGLPFQLFAIWLGESLVTLVTLAAPALLVATFVFGMAVPYDVASGLWAVISFALSFATIFCLNFLVGMLVMLSLSINGIQHAYHAVVTLLSGLWVPLWFYPSWLAAIANALPFKGLFFTPVAAYVGYLTGADRSWAIAQQALWAATLIATVELAWRLVQRRLVVQGG